jgi:hypothetical protein
MGQMMTPQQHIVQQPMMQQAMMQQAMATGQQPMTPQMGVQTPPAAPAQTNMAQAAMAQAATGYAADDARHDGRHDADGLRFPAATG